MSNTSSQPEPSTSTQFQVRSLLKLLPHYAYTFQVVSFRFPHQSPVWVSTWDYDHLMQPTKLRCNTATSLQLFEHMKHESVRYWNLKHADGLYVFFPPQQFALRKIVLLTCKSIWHPMKQLFIRLTHKNPRLYWHVNSATLPQSCTTHWQSSCCTIHDMYLPPNTGHFFFCKDLHFIFWHLNLDIWRTVLHFHAKEMQVLKEESIILCLHFWKNWAIKLSEVTLNSIPSMFSKSYYVPLLSGTICFKTRTQQIITHISLNDERSTMSLENSLQLVAQTYQNINIIITANIPFAFLLTQENCYYELFYVSSLL